ncbi:DUF92 domain-containing protein [Candidatus Micrarchaeota archaeon]|nr:DUF92 domain-containing protein [Candidatus Micrarchaeota archaeon]MBD3417629.1 DUF92 domain-containing protein [Candidatus Micrarchaeota archaeon]
MVAMLDKPGLALTFIFGLTILLLGDFSYLVLVFIFLLLSVLATKYGYYEKKEMGIYEHDRSWENVLSNGLVPTIVVALGYFLGWGPIPYICSIAAVTADKFASELGVLGGDPVSLDGLKEVAPGTSGAVSSTGTLMSLAGSAAVGIAAMFLFGITPNIALLVALAGFAGGLVDTLFGVFEEKGFGTKGTTNMICSIVGALIGLMVIA